LFQGLKVLWQVPDKDTGIPIRVCAGERLAEQTKTSAAPDLDSEVLEVESSASGFEAAAPAEVDRKDHDKQGGVMKPRPEGADKVVDLGGQTPKTAEARVFARMLTQERKKVMKLQELLVASRLRIRSLKREVEHGREVERRFNSLLTKNGEFLKHYKTKVEEAVYRDFWRLMRQGKVLGVALPPGESTVSDPDANTDQPASATGVGPSYAESTGTEASENVKSPAEARTEKTVQSNYSEEELARLEEESRQFEVRTHEKRIHRDKRVKNLRLLALTGLLGATMMLYDGVQKQRILLDLPFMFVSYYPYIKMVPKVSDPVPVRSVASVPKVAVPKPVQPAQPTAVTQGAVAPTLVTKPVQTAQTQNAQSASESASVKTVKADSPKSPTRSVSSVSAASVRKVTEGEAQLVMNYGEGRVRVQFEFAELYAKPGEEGSAEIITEVHRGVTVNGVDGDYYAVKVPGGPEGFIYREYLEPLEVAVFAKPGIRRVAIKGYIQFNSRVDVIQTSGDWTQVKFGKVSGWVPSIFIK
jgi:hypothetical protein